jgi:leucine dehydrogenase
MRCNTMKFFEIMKNSGHMQLAACCDARVGLRAIIAIHSTTLGPALAGCRMHDYKTEQAALDDALKLSMDMTRRGAISGCDVGGGSVIIMGNPKTDKTEELFRALGRFINGLDGRIVVTSELGTVGDDLAELRRETPYVVIPPHIGATNGEEALPAAWGIYYGIMACVKEVFKVASLKDLRLGIQGVGSLGSSLIHLMKKREPQVQLTISDIDYDKMKKIQDQYPEVAIASTEEMLEKEFDVLVPCAVGGLFKPEVVPLLKCRIIAGGATCTLSDDKVAEMIHEKGILMAPDFVINAGGVVQASHELRETEYMVTHETFKKLSLTLMRIIARAREEECSPYRVALKAAGERLEKIAHVNTIFSLK